VLMYARLARLDAPDALHHITIRGIERRKIFRIDKDREDFSPCAAPISSVKKMTGITCAEMLKCTNREKLKESR